MKRAISQSIEIPEGITCKIEGQRIICNKGDVSLSRTIEGPGVSASISGNVLTVNCAKGNKKHRALIHSLIAHISNMFNGANDKFVYNLEAANVHFPMTLKVDGNKLMINNFLGEKIPRYAKIVSGSLVEVKGQKITVSSNDKEVAGQTAANIEKATHVRNRDRRIFQDGIYIVDKPRREI